jgi:hypothetical protein
MQDFGQGRKEERGTRDEAEYIAPRRSKLHVGVSEPEIAASAKHQEEPTQEDGDWNQQSQPRQTLHRPTI